MRKRRAITLLEIMIVILLIGIISGVVGYNLKGTLDRGKAFRSEQGALKLQDILNLEIQEGRVTAAALAGDHNSNRPIVIQALKNSGLIPEREADKFIKDGWNNYFRITAEGKEVRITSQKLDSYRIARGETPFNAPPEKK